MVPVSALQFLIRTKIAVVTNIHKLIIIAWVIRISNKVVARNYTNQNIPIDSFAEQVAPNYTASQLFGFRSSVLKAQ